MEELKDDIHNKLEVLKEHTSDEEYIKKINQLSDELHKINEFKDTRKERKAIKKLNKKVTFYERFLEGLERDLDIDPSRLMGLTDGIFGMVMTLLVFGIALPELQIDSKNFLEKKPSKKEKRYVINTLIIIMGLTVIVNLLDFNVSGNFIYLFLLVPVITTIRYIMQYRNI